MRIMIINPNSDTEMSAMIENSARAFAGSDFEVVCKSVPGAPRFIETYQDKVAIARPMLSLVQSNERDFDAFIVACHSDPHLDAVKEITLKPTVGIGEASMKLASMLGHCFSIVTTDRHSIPAKKAQARKYHLENLLVSVRAPEREEHLLPPAELYLKLAERAVIEDLAEVIVLGCAGLTGLDREIQERLHAPVLDGVICALIIATGLVRYGVSTSKVLGYNPTP